MSSHACAEAESPPFAVVSAFRRRSSTSQTRRRVMVIADPSRESSAALDWTLEYAIVPEDEIILLHLETPNSSRLGGALSAFLRRPALSGRAGSPQHHHQPVPSSTSSSSSASSSASSLASSSAVSARSRDAVEYKFLEEMRAACEAAGRNVRVQVVTLEIVGKHKAATILAQTEVLGVDVLIFGQRRPFPLLRGCTMGGSFSGNGLDTAEFLIENCRCLCVGVQKRTRNPGYILNTKTNKNFWQVM